MILPRRLGSGGFLAREVARIPTGSALLEARLEVPFAACGLVLFVTVTGERAAATNELYAERRFHLSGLATLHVDLLADEEEALSGVRYDLRLLADRLRGASAWALRSDAAARFRQGYYGSAGGAAAVLAASADSGPSGVGAIVCRSARTDLAADSLPAVRAPTLFLVGERDEVTLDLNRRALESLRAEKRLLSIPNAGPFFDEPAALEEVTRLASSWFEVHLSADTS